MRRPYFVFLAVVSLCIATAFNVNPQQIDPKTYGGMKWRLVGPFRGGRVLTVAGVPSEPNTYYFGAVAGGVWKTTDGGNTWDPLFDKQGISSIGSIAISDSDPNVVFAGSGEACIRGNISFGDGVYKSTDQGKTWTNVGLKDTRHIGAVIIHPTNPDVVFIAALGHAYGPNTERGVFRTRDGGKTWEKVLYIDDHTGGDRRRSSIPTIPTFFLPRCGKAPHAVDAQQRRREERSLPFERRWLNMEAHRRQWHCRKAPLGRSASAVSGADSNIVYALIEAKKGGLYRSNDGGENWSARQRRSPLHASAPGISRTSGPIPKSGARVHRQHGPFPFD